MADIRCPMCGKPNDDANVECRFCGSRLKPLVMSGEAPAANLDATVIRSSLKSSWGAPEGETGDAEEPEGEQPEEAPAWLQRLRTQTGSIGAQPPARDPDRTLQSPRVQTPPPPAAPPPPPPAASTPKAPAPKAAEPEAGRRRTTGDLFRSLRTAALQNPEDEEAAASSAAPPPSAAAGASPTWLSSLRKQSLTAPLEPTSPAEPEAPPAAPKPGEPEAAAMPGWLQSLREHVTEEPPSEAAPPPAPATLISRRPDPSLFGGPTDFPGLTKEPPAGEPPVADTSLEGESDIPDWLRSARPPGVPDAPASPGLPSADLDFDELPDWMKAMPAAPQTDLLPLPAATESGDPDAGLPDWLRSIGAPPEVPTSTESPEPGSFESLGLSPKAPAPEPASPPAAEPGEMPDWLRSIGESRDAPVVAPAGGTPDWLDTLPPAPHPFDEPLAAEPAPESTTPDWLASLAMPPAPAAPEAPAEPALDDFPPVAQPWDEAAPAAPPAPSASDETGAHELPDWLEALRPTGDVPAGPLPDLPPAAPSADATLVQQPVAPFEASNMPGLTPADLQKATLPSWLEAMRPMPAPVAQPAAAAAADYEETTGPLAGMKGVLAAEPAISLPTIRLSAATLPVISETHAAQVKAIEALIKEETASRPVAKKSVARPIVALFERWIVFAVLALAVVAPFILDGTAPTFAQPSLYPGETVAARDVVATLPADRPVLIAFEYDPGAAGEMDLLAGALIQHLADRGLRVAAVSTRPMGPALAQAALERGLAGAGGDIPADRLFVNMGYLPGGALALPLFAADPRGVTGAGFDTAAGETALWNTVVLGNVRTLADFSLVAVVSNSPESTRMWIEQLAVARQAQGGAPQPPMIALVSAAAEPLVQPYYLAADPESPLQGLVSGQFGAAGYQQLVGAAPAAEAAEAVNLAARRWDAQAYGLLAAAAVIAFGTLIFGSFSLLRRKGNNPA